MYIRCDALDIDPARHKELLCAAQIAVASKTDTPISPVDRFFPVLIGPYHLISMRRVSDELCAVSYCLQEDWIATRGSWSPSLRETTFEWRISQSS